MVSKQDLINEIAQELNCTKADTERFLSTFQAKVLEHVSKGEEVKLAGFMAISTGERAARKGKNPRTGEDMTVPARKIVKLRAMKGLKDAVQDTDK